jgi:hypothetical protein
MVAPGVVSVMVINWAVVYVPEAGEITGVAVRAGSEVVAEMLGAKLLSPG